MRQGIARRLRLLVDRQSSLTVSYLVYTLALGFSGVVQLALLFLFGRLLPAAEFGLVTILMIAIPLAARFVTLGSDIGLGIRIWKQPRSDQQADLSAMLTWSSANAALIMLVGLAVWNQAVAGLPPWFFACGLLAAVARNVNETLQMMLRRENRVAEVGAIIVARALLLAALCALARAAVAGAASAYLLPLVACEGLIAVWALARLHRLYGLAPCARGSGARMKELLRVGFPTMPKTLAILLLAGGDRFVVSGMLGLAAAGVYAFGQRLADAVSQYLFYPFAIAFSPVAMNAASQDQRRALDMIGRSAITLGYLGGVALGVPVVFARELVLALLGPDYAQSATVFLLVAGGSLAFHVSQIVAVYFNQTEQIPKHMWILLAATAGSFALNLVVVPAWGIVGAAVVSLAVFHAVLVTVTLTARPAGVPLVAIGALHVPLLLFYFYLLVIHLVDARALGILPAVAAKTGLWACYLAAGLALSRDARVTVAGMARRLRLFLAS